MTKPLRVLVTGASGFIGTHLVQALLRQGHAVVATTTRRRTGLPTAERLEWVEWDAASRSEPPVAWPEIDAIAHLAVPRPPTAFPQNAEVSFRLTVESTFRMLERARISGVSRFVLASTGSALEPGEGPATEEQVAYTAASFYAATKGCAELLARAYAGELPTAVVRLFHPYGPGGDRFLMNRLLGRVAAGEEITIEGTDGIVVNPAWVEDAAEGIRLAIESAERGIFHIAGPETLTLRELILEMGKALGLAPRIRSIEGAPAGRHHADFARARELLGYEPRVGIPEGLRRLVALAQLRAADQTPAGEDNR